MFLLQDFFKYLKKENKINLFSFFLAFIVNAFLYIIFLNYSWNKIVWFFSFIIIYLSFNYLLGKIFENKFLNIKKDLVSFIFYREFVQKEKYDINKNFSKKEIEDFIEHLNCEEFVAKNKIPLEYFYLKNNSYCILKFEKEYLKHYTRKIPWKNLSWKYFHNSEEDGFIEYLEIEYVNENKETIKEEIITDRIQQKSSFHLLLLFIIHDLKYGQRLSLDKGYYMKKKSSFKIDLFD